MRIKLSVVGRNLCLVTFVLLFSSYQSVYGAYATFTFEMPDGSSEQYIPLSFSDNGIVMDATANSGGWRQTDSFPFSGLSGWVLSSDFPLSPFPTETLTLMFSESFSQFEADYAIANLYGESTSLTLLAFSGASIVGSTVRAGVGVDSGSISIVTSTSFDRIELSSGEDMGFGIDNVQVNNVPLPGSIFMFGAAFACIAILKKVRKSKEHNSNIAASQVEDLGRLGGAH